MDDKFISTNSIIQGGFDNEFVEKKENIRRFKKTRIF